MLFVWDPHKAQINLKKHGVSFELAQTVFEDPLHLSVLEKKGLLEERWITIGHCAESSLLLVVHLYQDTEDSDEVTRIISARRATRKEIQQYEEGI